jgi:DNA primase
MFDFARIFRENGIPFIVDMSSGWVNIKCPFCADHSFHGGFNLKKGYFHCWRCGGHRLDLTLARLLKIEEIEVDNILFEYQGRSVFIKKLNNKQKNISKLHKMGEELNRRDLSYLRKRGFDPDFLIKKYQITSGGFIGDWKFRILIPIIYDGQLISYQGRDITGKQKLRYKTLSNELSIKDPKTILYNLDNCTSDMVVLVEGVFDCWKLGDGVAATFGTSMTEAQINLLSRRFSKIRFLFDPEPAAQKRALFYANKIAALGVSVDVLDSELGHDPGDFTEKEVQIFRDALGLRNV